MVSHWGLFPAWLLNVAFSTILVAVATWTVVEIAPAAAGAGVAEVMAYLNGCHVPKVPTVCDQLRPKTFACSQRRLEVTPAKRLC